MKIDKQTLIIWTIREFPYVLWILLIDLLNFRFIFDRTRKGRGHRMRLPVELSRDVTLTDEASCRTFEGRYSIR